MAQQNCLKRYKYYYIAAVLLIVVAGSIGYYIFTKEQSSNEKDEPNIVDKDKSNDTNTSESFTIPKVPVWENNPEIEIFREYLRIPTVHPDVDYKPAVAFLEKQAESLDLPMSVFYPVNEDNPVVVMTWNGSEPELPSIMLNSHMDVVPVFEEYWTHPPFGAEMDENGDIFARGAQDMKPVGMQYLAAIRALKQEGVDRLKRTVHVVYVPDEERGGTLGMAGFVNTGAFRDLNVGFVLDEGQILSNDEGALYAFYGERPNWKVEFIVHGASGHGSRLFPNTPGEKLTNLLVKLNDFRNEQVRKLNETKGSYGNVTSINLTILKGGVQNNVVPAEMSAIFDMRISIDADLDELEQQLIRWCEEAGGNITINFLSREGKMEMTDISDSNPFWVAFKSAVDDSGLLVKPYIIAGNTDSRFIRQLNIPAIGFSPLIGTVSKMHDHNEYINAGVYLAGIDVYQKIIVSLSNA